MALTTSTGANAIREAYEPGFVEAVFRNNSLLQHLPAPTMSLGDTSRRWKVNNAGNTSVEVFTEGAAQPAAGYQSYVNAAVAWVYLRVMIEVTGHMKDALRSQWFDAIDEEAVLGRQDLVDLLTTSWMGSTYGIELAIDSSSSYAGITRSSSTYWQSTETAVNDNIAASDLMDLQEAIKDNDKGGSPGLIICAVSQETNIYNLSGVPAVQYIGDQDKAPNLRNQLFAGMPVVGLPDWTDETVAMLDVRPGEWARVVHRPFQVDEMGKSGDTDRWQLSYAECLKCANPKHQGKLTGCTA